MTGSIGYVQTIREDLLEAAWRSTMSSPRRAPRRRPTMRWVVAGASALSLIVAGVVGWQILGSDRTKLLAESTRLPHELRSQSERRASLATSAPAPADTLQRADEGAAAAGVVPGAAVSDEAAGYASYGVEAPAVRPPAEFAKVIKTARMSIVVGHDAFEDRWAAVGDIADRLGGYLSSSTTTGGRSGSVTMRIPAKRFQEALRSLRGLGRIDAETIEGQDVTAEFVDLAARIRIAKARREVLFDLMRRAVSIEQTIRVQNALDDVQLRIEELQGELNVLNDRVSEATIRISMRETGVKMHAEANVENPSLGSAVDHAFAGFFSVIAAVIIGLGWVIPTIVVLLGLWFVVTRVRRRLA